MHRSRIGVLLIDHPGSSAGSAASFWAGALGSEPARGGDDDPYTRVRAADAGLPVQLEVQRTGEGTASRIHLDIETDDVTAEVARLLALGAVVEADRVEDGYTIMRDPGGLLFCVVPVQTGEVFEWYAVTWQD
ncbi:VOC family protein [Dermacoccaceae bacterium W4C1]